MIPRKRPKSDRHRSAASEALDRPVREFARPVQTSLRMGQNVGEALANLRQRQVDQQIVYFYVLDEDDRLVGVIPTRRLLLAQPEHRTEQIMYSPVVGLRATQTLGEALEMFANYRYLALPVMDDEGRLLGAVDVRLYADEAYDLAQVHRVNDLFQVIGLKIEQLRQGTPVTGFRLRMPWLLCNVFSGLICAGIAMMFLEVLDEVVLLAMFFPLVLTLSESISMQSMTISLQFLHSRRVPWRIVGGRANLEWRTAALLGIGCGVLVGLMSVFWSSAAGGHGPMLPATVLAVSILGSMTASALLGIGLPVSLHALRLDPKVASGPVVLMMADIITTAVYLGLGTWLLLPVP
jgi:magnesium transporter